MKRSGDRTGTRRFFAWNAAIVAVFAVAFVALGLLMFDLLHGDDQSSAPQVSMLPPVSITGPEETVLDWSKDGCSAYDFADLPARAYRDASGDVQLIVSHFENRRMSGPALGRVEHSCDLVMRSDSDPNPARFNDREWVAAPYTIDGHTVYALVHHEYQGNRHPGRCRSGVYQNCWYNAITFARSGNGGRTFSQPQSPRHFVAGIPYRYAPEAGPYGLFSPSNIVRNPRDGHYYALLVAEEYRAQERGSCLIRTPDLSNPRWRAWNGSSFDTRFVDPYPAEPADSLAHVCTPVSPNEIGAMSSSLTWSTYFNKWLLVGTSADRNERGEDVWGIFYSLSDDLISWQRRKLIREVEFPWTHECQDRNPVMYPSLLDPSSSSRNFETVGKNPWLYFTRVRYEDCKLSLNRDLVRVPIAFG